MKNLFLVVLAIAVAAVGTLYVKETGKRGQAAAAADALERRVAELEAAAAAEETKRTELRAELEKSWNEGAAKDRQVAELKAASASPATAAALAAGKPAGKTANPMSALGKLFDDPAMKEMIATQQKAAMGPMIDKMYGKFFSDLGLSAEESAALKEMLLKKQMAGAEMGLSMLSEEGGANAAELGAKMKAANEASEAEIKAFLGDERYAQLKEHEKSSADRMAVSGFREQLGAGAALSAEQEQRLVAAMGEAREGFKFTTDFSDPSKMSGNFAATFNEENVNRFMQEMDQLNQRYVAHAQDILSPNQLEAFQKHLSQQQALQKAGMQMGAKLLRRSRGSRSGAIGAAN